eukprot:g30896.t1
MTTGITPITTITSSLESRQIQLRYVDRVLPNVGLCIEFYNFVNAEDAMIYPGDGKHSCGEAYVKVEFQLIVFQPLVDEWLVRDPMIDHGAVLRKLYFICFVCAEQGSDASEW